jgi:hypothetical protein
MQPGDDDAQDAAEDEATVVEDLVMPSRWSAPSAAEGKITEVLEVCEACGLKLDPWQRFVLEHSLGLRDDGKFAAFEVGVTVPSQNGKGGVLEARELAGLFVFGERMMVHSAHQFDTSMEAFMRMEMAARGGRSAVGAQVPKRDLEVARQRGFLS